MGITNGGNPPAVLFLLMQVNSPWGLSGLYPYAGKEGPPSGGPSPWADPAPHDGPV